jgi:NAD+ synthase (glutamine-hydrolysing)
VRERILTRAAHAMGAPLFYCNLVGGQDELVFDGGSLVVGPHGILARAEQFKTDTLSVQSSNHWKKSSERVPTIGKSPLATPALTELAEVYAALTLGLRDYVDKNGFKGVVLGISGGIDSALVAALAVDALGADRVTA